MNKKIFKVLVVDDEESLRDICKDVLQDEGYEVLQAKDGQDALQILSKEQDIDLVISDLKMPKMNGLELLKAVKEKKIDVDFVVMTGFGTIETAVECMKMGAADYLPKPFNINHLLVKVNKSIKSRRQRLERKRLSSVVRVLNLSNALNSHLDLKSLVYEFVSHIQKNFRPDSVVLFLVDESKKLVKSVVRGKIFRINTKIFSFVQQKSQEVLDGGRSQLIDRYTFQGKGFDNFPYSLIIVPLMSQMQKVGVVALIREKDRELFTPRDVQLLSIFASHAANSFQNAKMYTKLRDMNMDIIRSYAKAVEAKDYYTKGHSENVASYALVLGSKLGLSSSELEKLYTAGVLHDIGKIGIPDHILNKPGRLTEEEFAIMKEHPLIGREILSQVWTLKDIFPLVYHHHERIDGNGYPDGLKGDELPFLGRLISVVDSFEAMTSDRAYRKALPLPKVEKILEEGAGRQWDEELVEKWLKLVREAGMDGLKSGALISRLKGVLHSS